MPNPLKLPFFATACAAAGQFIWLASIGDDCSLIGARGRILLALVAVGAIGEACASAVRGGGWLSFVLWAAGSAVILLVWAWVVVLFALDAGKCL